MDNIIDNNFDVIDAKDNGKVDNNSIQRKRIDKE